MHRIGRTARAGAAGKAISLADEASALAARAHREVHRPEDPRGVGGGRPLSCPRSSRPARSAAATPRRSARAWPRAAAAGRGGGPGRPGGGGGGGRRDGRGPAAARAASPMPSPVRGEGRVRSGGDAARLTRASTSAFPMPSAVSPRALDHPWRDFLYAPGPGFTSPLDPGALPLELRGRPGRWPGRPRVLARDARLRRRAVPPPARGARATIRRRDPRLLLRADAHRPVYALTPGPRGGAAPRARAARSGATTGRRWPTRLGRVGGVRLLRERGRGGDGSWEADRGLVLTDADGGECLLLAVAEPAEAALFLPSPGLYRALLDPAARRQPRVTARDLLGYGDRGRTTSMSRWSCSRSRSSGEGGGHGEVAAGTARGCRVARDDPRDIPATRREPWRPRPRREERRKPPSQSRAGQGEADSRRVPLGHAVPDRRRRRPRDRFLQARLRREGAACASRRPAIGSGTPRSRSATP